MHRLLQRRRPEPAQNLEPLAKKLLARRVEHALGASDGPILAGPWLGEVGWEVLYWIPVLRFAVHRWPELRERLVVVSRGGVGSWYDGIGCAYVDLLDAYDQQTFSTRLDNERVSRRDRGQNLLKQVTGATPWEEEIAAWVGERFDREPLPMLHPSLLYSSGAAKKLVSALADAPDGIGFQRWPYLDRGELGDVLPERYVAVRFYYSSMMRDPSGRYDAHAYVKEAVQILAKQLPIVTLDPGMETDPQHPDYALDADVVPLAPHASFERNLELQSRVIANAVSFVGTFGGLAFLAPHWNVPSFGFWSATHRGHPSSKKGPWRDLDIAERAFNRPGWGGLVARHFADAPLEELLAPAVG